MTPQLLEIFAKAGELGIALLVLYGAGRIFNKLADAWIASWQAQADALSSYMQKLVEATARVAVQLEQLHEDHSEITMALRRLNGKSETKGGE